MVLNWNVSRYNCFPCDFDACADCAAKEGEQLNSCVHIDKKTTVIATMIIYDKTKRKLNTNAKTDHCRHNVKKTTQGNCWSDNAAELAAEETARWS